MPIVLRARMARFFHVFFKTWAFFAVWRLAQHQYIDLHSHAHETGPIFSRLTLAGCTCGEIFYAESSGHEVVFQRSFEHGMIQGRDPAWPRKLIVAPLWILMYVYQKFLPKEHPWHRKHLSLDDWATRGKPGTYIVGAVLWLVTLDLIVLGLLWKLGKGYITGGYQ
jgi:hypothetical protein